MAKKSCRLSGSKAVSTAGLNAGQAPTQYDEYRIIYRIILYRIIPKKDIKPRKAVRLGYPGASSLRFSLSCAGARPQHILNITLEKFSKRGIFHDFLLDMGGIMDYMVEYNYYKVQISN